MVAFIGVMDNEPRGVSVSAEVIDINVAAFHEGIDERENKQSIGCGGDGEPLIGDGRVSCLDGVYGDDFDASVFELTESDFDRVAVVVFGDSEEEKEFGAFPIRGSEFPERSADGVDAGSCHVDRAEASVGCEIWRAELLRPPACECLRLVSAGEESEALWVGVADRFKPVGGEG